MRISTLLIVNFIVLLTVLTSVPVKTSAQLQWQKCLGGSNGDWGYIVQQTKDGGYIVGATSGSEDGDVDTTVSGGVGGCWIVKITDTGSIQWEKIIPIEVDNNVVVKESADSGYFVTFTSYYDSDTYYYYGGRDIMVYKLNDTGKILWQKRLGGTFDDWASDLVVTSDSGCIVAGYTESINGDVSGNHGGDDCWIVKLTAGGAIQWQKCFGGSNDDQGFSIEQVADTGYIIAGATTSNDADVSGKHGDSLHCDYWLVKINDTGGIQWQKCFGGSDDDMANSVRLTSDGGYIIAGISASDNEDVTGHHGDTLTYDYWIVKTNDTGAIQWERSLGGTDNDFAYCGQQTFDGGYIVAGFTLSDNGDVDSNYGYSDGWVIKLNPDGAISWEKNLGGSSGEMLYSVQQAADSGYVVAGYTESDDHDVHGNHGGGDCWVAKILPAGFPSLQTKNVEEPAITVSPNPTISTISVQSGRLTVNELTDITGKTIIPKTTNTTLDLSSLSPGIYLLNVYDAQGNRIKTEKVVKE